MRKFEEGDTDDGEKVDEDTKEKNVINKGAHGFDEHGDDEFDFLASTQEAQDAEDAQDSEGHGHGGVGDAIFRDIADENKTEVKDIPPRGEEAFVAIRGDVAHKDFEGEDAKDDFLGDGDGRERDVGFHTDEEGVDEDDQDDGVLEPSIGGDAGAKGFEIIHDGDSVDWGKIAENETMAREF